MPGDSWETGIFQLYLQRALLLCNALANRAPARFAGARPTPFAFFV
jgi:hypothetical protein